MNRMQHKIFAIGLYLAIYFLWSYFGNSSDYPIIFWISMLFVIIGSEIPDFDLDFGAKYHRSPITHSAIIPIVMFTYYYVTAPPEWVFEFIGWFCIGYASHLFGDLIPSKKDIVSAALTVLDPRGVPGDIRHIPERYEYIWLIASGTISSILAIISLMIGRGIQF